ncbi:MAG TPA: hypothetical protein VLK30_04580 [Candidatus Limnocylindrales bacterium]|nr:hypothetical protein [Candidatus Limnocylindrales bacterium]
MRVPAGALAITCLLLAACTVTPVARTSPAPVAESTSVACPDGKPEQPGLQDFGAYIGTWDAHHERVAQTGEYTIGTFSGRVAVQCSTADYIIVEVMKVTFQVPSGRALQYALTELPADSKKIYDRTHSGCRALQYQSHQLAQQLSADDHEGLADITVQNAMSSNPSDVAVLVTIRVAGKPGGDTSSCF